jgi:thiol-disulfide isomerase/thioredoxin
MSAQQSPRVRAPELTGGRGWLNTGKPLTIAALKGKVVLLDFWTYGCINCIHIIPDLKRLEQKYANQLVVIGVHSAKFENEKDTENIRRIILRYELEHPVYNDADYKVWQSYGVRAWPTQVLIDPAGYVIGSVSGEGNYELIDQVIAKVVAEFRKRGELNEEPLKLALERATVGELPLQFPGKILADEKGQRLFIADSNHNRIVVTRFDGTLIATIGTGVAGAADGAFEQASFFRPQGMALDGDDLYVADTENHLIRRVDLKSHNVATAAGTGQQTREYFKTGPARSIALSSPWDLQLVGRQLYITMAGTHQIWKLDLDKQEVATFAGSGREARLDGPLLEAGFAQPSGITSDGKHLFIADSESNVIRSIDLASGAVVTLAGGDLFDFGDVDGTGDDVRLQHPLGVVARNGHVLIADTYNHKLRELDPRARSVKTFLGTGKPGQSDGAVPTFYEPGGLSIADGKLFIADTNNQAVRVVDLKTKHTSTLKLKGLEPPRSNALVTSAETESGPNATESKVAPQTLRAESDVAIVAQLELPRGYHLNPAAPQRYRISVAGGAPQLGLVNESQSLKNPELPLHVPLRTHAPGQTELHLQLTLFYCREDNTGTCRIKTLLWRIPVSVKSDSGAQEITVQAKLAAD